MANDQISDDDQTSSKSLQEFITAWSEPRLPLLT